MTSKRSHPLIQHIMLIGVSIKQRLSLQRCHRLKLVLMLLLIKTLSYWKMVRRICKITVTLDFIFQLVLCSHDDVSFNIIYLDVLEGIIQFYLSMWFKKTRLETPIAIGDNVNALIKTSNCENWFFISLRKVRKLQHLLCFFDFQWPNNRLKMFWLPAIIRNTHVTR